MLILDEQKVLEYHHSEVSESDIRLIDQIVSRFISISKKDSWSDRDRPELIKRISIFHTGGYYKLDLDKLIGSTEKDFRHDVLGIYNNLDPETGLLAGPFLPHSILSKESILIV